MYPHHTSLRCQPLAVSSKAGDTRQFPWSLTVWHEFKGAAPCQGQASVTSKRMCERQQFQAWLLARAVIINLVASHLYIFFNIQSFLEDFLPFFWWGWGGGVEGLWGSSIGVGGLGWINLVGVLMFLGVSPHQNGPAIIIRFQEICICQSLTFIGINTIQSITSTSKRKPPPIQNLYCSKSNNCYPYILDRGCNIEAI